MITDIISASSSTNHAMVAVHKDICGSVADALHDWRGKDCVEESSVARRLVENLDRKVLDLVWMIILSG